MREAIIHEDAKHRGILEKHDAFTLATARYMH